MALFDAHTHLHDKAFDEDRDAVIARMKEAGVRAVTVGTDKETSIQAVELARLHDFLWASIGLHPNDNREELFDAEAYGELAKDPKVVAVGECGLDYFRGAEGDKERQKKAFEAQILFALQYDKPLMIHCREAHEDALSILQSFSREYGEKVRGVIHFFTAGEDTAKRYLELGFLLSYPGVVTFTGVYDEAVRATPLDRLLSETDAPYASPAPFRGKRNEPLYVRHTVERLAELKGISAGEMEARIAENAARTFRIPAVA